MTNIKGKLLFVVPAITFSLFGINILKWVTELVVTEENYPSWVENISVLFLPVPLFLILCVIYGIVRLTVSTFKDKIDYKRSIHTHFLKKLTIQKSLVLTALFLFLILGWLQYRVIVLSKKENSNSLLVKTTSTPTSLITTPSPRPTVIPTATPTPDPKKVIGDCKGTAGSKCEGKSIRISLEACQSGSYVCCQTSSGWEIKSKTECQQLQQGNKLEYVLVTLPHNLKQYYCPKGIDSQAYNMSQEVVNKTIELSDSVSQDFFLEAIKVVDEFVSKNCK